MASLKEIVKEEVEWYASGGGFHHEMFAASDDKNQVYVVIAKGTDERPFAAEVVVMARIVDDTVIIDADNTDKPLFRALEKAGVPSEKIIRAYEGIAGLNPQKR